MRDDRNQCQMDLLFDRVVEELDATESLTVFDKVGFNREQRVLVISTRSHHSTIPRVYVSLQFSSCGWVYAVVEDEGHRCTFRWDHEPTVRELKILVNALIDSYPTFQGAIHIVGLVAIPLIAGYLCN